MKTKFIELRDAELATAREYRMKAGRERTKARKEHGAANDPSGMNPFPISGGTCDHWPREVSDKVMEYVHAKQDAITRANECHKRAGLHQVTFNRLMREVHHLI